MRTSKLGMLYDVKQSVNRINDIANVLESDFEAYITFKETLPITTKVTRLVVQEYEVEELSSALSARGMTVVFDDELLNVTLIALK